jgi:hypothetical protein
MRSGDKSSAHDKQCSSRRDFSERDIILRPDLADIVEDDEERIFPANDASNELMYFSPRGTSSGGSPMFLSPHRRELAINKLCIGGERAHAPDDDVKIRATCRYHMTIGCDKGAQCPLLHPAETWWSKVQDKKRKAVLRSPSESFIRQSSVDPELTRITIALIPDKKRGPLSCSPTDSHFRFIDDNQSPGSASVGCTFSVDPDNSDNDSSQTMLHWPGRTQEQE